MAHRNSKKPFGKQITKGYRLLSTLNTLSTLLSGDPQRIMKHLMRKRAHGVLGKIIR